MGKKEIVLRAFHAIDPHTFNFGDSEMFKYVVMGNKKDVYFTDGMGYHKNLVEEGETAYSAGTITVSDGKNWRWVDNYSMTLKVRRDVDLDTVLISEALGLPRKDFEMPWGD